MYCKGGLIMMRTRDISAIVLGLLLVAQASFATYYVGVVRGVADTARVQIEAIVHSHR
jgi:hypothetical protein